jgi:hypothetical protein
MSLIQKFLGHAHIKTTVDFYLHTSIQTMQNIFAAADARIIASNHPSARIGQAQQAINRNIYCD